MSHDFGVSLYRDSLSTPWGFRLEGGKDFYTPLTIQRVFTGSPASSDLQRGDIITSVQGQSTANMVHQEANEVIKSAGGSLQLNIRRTGSFAPPPPMYQQQQQAQSSFSQPQPSFNGHHQPRSLYLNQQQHNYHNNQPYTTPHHANYRPNNHIFNGNINFSPYGQTYGSTNNLSYIRSRHADKVPDPKPILSQTGSPLMPQQIDHYGHHVRALPKRYRAATTAPLFGANRHGGGGGGDDYYIKSQLQQTLSRIAPGSYQQQQPSYQSYGDSSYNSQPSSSSYLQYQPSSYQQQQHTPYNVESKVISQKQLPQQINYQQQSSASKAPKIKNTAYNTPIGLYSADNLKKELFNKIGNSSELQFEAASEF